VSVKHTKVDTTFLKVADLLDSGLSTVCGCEFDLDRAWLSNDVVLAAVLITKSMSSNDNRLSPSWYATRNVGDDDGLSEDSAIKDVSDCTVGAPPHLLEVEFLDTALVGGDGGALDGDLVLLGCVGGINCDLIVRRVTRCH